ncbi:MAG TPA: DUF6338 family protein [Chloroflexota bacterium]|nr:DUF6338 family protein [Chloroflexota bacterium]
MIPTDFQTVAILLLAIVPGFIATSSWAQAKTWKGRSSDLLTILQSLSISLILQLLMAPFTVHWFYAERAHLDQHPLRVAAWLALVVLVLPILGGSFVARLTDWLFAPGDPAVRRFLRRLVSLVVQPGPAPTIWDWLFTAQVPNGCFLVIEFTDGSRVAGAFGLGSRAHTSPEPQGVYLTTEWVLDSQGNLIGAIPGSKGVMISRSTDIKTIRILEGGQHGAQP